MTDKDIKEYHKLIKKLEEKNKFDRLQQEQRDLEESYQQSKRNKKEHSDKEK